MVKKHSLTSWILSIILLFYAATISFNFFNDLYGEPPPLNIRSFRIVNPTPKSGEPLQFEINANIIRGHCDSYVERTVSATGTNRIVWASISPVYRDVEAKENDVTISVDIGTIPPGDYIYKGIVHLACGPDNFVAPTPFIPFTIVK